MYIYIYTCIYTACSVVWFRARLLRVHFSPFWGLRDRVWVSAGYGPYSDPPGLLIPFSCLDIGKTVRTRSWCGFRVKEFEAF